MVKFLLLLVSLVNASLLENNNIEIETLDWNDFEHRAYTQRFQIPFKRNAPFNKPPTKPYYEMSEYSIEWLRKRHALRDAYRLTVPQYYMTPFITKDMTD
jgi:hypothetical protein